MTINNQCNKLAYEKALEVLAPQFLNKQEYISYSDALKCYQGLLESQVKKASQL